MIKASLKRPRIRRACFEIIRKSRRGRATELWFADRRLVFIKLSLCERDSSAVGKSPSLKGNINLRLLNLYFATVYRGHASNSACNSRVFSQT